ncbi:MAG: hypothetical protein PHW10_03570 [Candidatus Peribacteraceae bacterium]|nr:hypothetical protein [Candidatus Peribacteraceae bacterium]
MFTIEDGWLVGENSTDRPMVVSYLTGVVPARGKGGSITCHDMLAELRPGEKLRLARLHAQARTVLDDALFPSSEG